jgi:transcriptional regulator with XRE-family HTH domain
LRHRGRAGLIQRDLAARAGAGLRSVQDWEAGATLPTAERLRALIRALLETGGLTDGRERQEARELWAAAEREGSRMHTPFDDEWFVGLLAARESTTPATVSDAVHTARSAEPQTGTAERKHDWGEAPDTTEFVGRAEELAQLRQWVLQDRSRLVALVGIGGIGKTSLASRLARELAPSFDYVYWRSLRDAQPVSEWLPGAIGFLSNQQLVPPSSESERIDDGGACLVG